MVTVPSPQCVGREFVRQYYTLLNQEPVQIHRYYEFFIIISGGCRQLPIYTPGWRETKWSKVPCLRKQCDRQGLNPIPPDLEFEVLTARPHTPPWVLATYCWGVTLWWLASRPGGSSNTPSYSSCYGNHYKLWPFEPLVHACVYLPYH